MVALLGATPQAKLDARIDVLNFLGDGALPRACSRISLTDETNPGFLFDTIRFTC
jgi:hypothetical protein